MINWTKVSEKMPITHKNSWSEYQESDRLLVKIVPDFRSSDYYEVRFGKYLEAIHEWQIEGITSSKPIPVTHWSEINDPTD